jgi:hypothetical protein
MDAGVIAELAAALATVVATFAAIPQLHRVARVGDGRGVSVTSAVLGIGSEIAWLWYAGRAALWSAMPEAGILVVGNAVLAGALLWRGASVRRALPAGLAWIGALATITVVGGPTALGAVLGVTYAVQIAPAVWTAWRTASPSGVAAATWALIGLEGLLWGVYGLHHGDPAVLTFAATATVASAATLARKLTVTRGPRSELPCQHDQVLQRALAVAHVARQHRFAGEAVALEQGQAALVRRHHLDAELAEPER